MLRSRPVSVGWDHALPAAQVRALFGLADTAGVDASGFDAPCSSREGDQADVELDGVTLTEAARGLGGADGEVLLRRRIRAYGA